MRFWGAEQDAVIIEHYNKMRAKQIAELLGVTKNAVIGRAKRLGLSRTNIGRAKRLGLSRTKEARVKSHKPLSPFGSWRRKGWDRIQRMFRPRPEPVTVVSIPGGISIMELTGSTCRWPVSGTGADMMYCGGEVHKEQSYCLEHCRIAFYGFKK